MTGAILLGRYRPGNTLLHRLPPGAKFLGLLLAGIGLVLVHSPYLAVGAAAVAAGLVMWVGGGVRTVLTTLRGLLVVAVLLGGWLVWHSGWSQAVDTVGDLVALVLAAAALLISTAVNDMLDTIARLARPLRVFGVDPERVSLAFSLMIRAIPSTLEAAEQSRQAALARGLGSDPRARLIPLAIRVVAQAKATGDALHARGIGDPD